MPLNIAFWRSRTSRRPRGHKVREYNELSQARERAALRAADYLRGAARPAAHTWTEKSQHTFVTEIDRVAEALIAEEIVREAPESVIIGEELSPERMARGALVWIVDPLDGTTNFLHGYPQYAVSIGCLVDGKLAGRHPRRVPQAHVQRHPAAVARSRKTRG